MSSLAFALTTTCITNIPQAFPQGHWVLQAGEQLEVLRDFVCFGEDRAGERTTFKTVTLSKNVISAEVFISGFNMWYTRDGHDHEVIQQRVDAWVDRLGGTAYLPPETRSPGFIDPRYVTLKFMYTLRDEDTSDSDDFNDACIGFTVVARTK